MPSSCRLNYRKTHFPWRGVGIFWILQRSKWIEKAILYPDPSSKMRHQSIKFKMRVVLNNSKQKTSHQTTSLIIKWWFSPTFRSLVQLKTNRRPQTLEISRSRTSFRTTLSFQSLLGCSRRTNSNLWKRCSTIKYCSPSKPTTNS